MQILFAFKDQKHYYKLLKRGKTLINLHMKRILLLSMLLCGLMSANAQKELIEKIENQAIMIDSLKDDIKSLVQRNEDMQRIIIELKDYKKFMEDKKKYDLQLRQKRDSIDLLKSKISTEINKGEKQAKDGYQKGQQLLLTKIIEYYKGRKFDELIEASTRESIKRDLEVAGETQAVKQILSDLNKYFDAKESLNKKFDKNQINEFQKQLNQIKSQSELVTKLKENLESYQLFNDELYETIGKINALDIRESVGGMSVDIRKKKLDKILVEISTYIFDYDFNFVDYPYLTEIVLEVMKLKHTNQDADIKHLLESL